MQQDVEFFSRLESVYRALALAVQDPVIISNPKYEGGPKIIDGIDVSRVYFYVEEDVGDEIVRGRIEGFAPEMRSFFREHQQLEKMFDRIEQHAKEGNRANVAAEVENVCQEVLQYGLKVRVHQLKRPEDFFQLYPRYTGEGITHRDGHLTSIPAFNRDGTAQGLFDDLVSIARFVKPFAASSKPLKPLPIYTGMPDHSYSASMNLTRMLLKKHLDFDLDAQPSQLVAH